MEPIVYKSFSIPEQIRKDVETVVDRTRGKMFFNLPDLQYLFQVYNRYIAPAEEPEDINCNNCKGKVVNRLRRIVDNWKANGFKDSDYEELQN